MAEIIYWKHSGFSVRTNSRLLLFDYLPAGMPEPRPEDRALAFVSHVHADHASPQVEAWAEAGLVTRVIGDELPPARGDARLDEGDSAELGGALVRAFGSTDRGVSFHVEADGLRVFHAGDLNFWHWRAESTAGEVEAARAAFDRVLDTLEGLAVDVAFFPVDPRLGGGAGEGAMLFAERVRPKWLIPMHWWGKPETAEEFAKSTMPEGVRALALTRRGRPHRFIA